MIKSFKKNDILQILTKLKTCPTPQGGLFLFLVTLYILENFEDQEILELISVIIFESNTNFLEEEWSLYIASLSFLLGKIEHFESEKIDLLMKRSKNMPAFLGVISEDKHLIIKSLEIFKNKNNNGLIVPKIKEDKLEKMLLPNLGKLLSLNDIEKELTRITENKLQKAKK